MSPTFRGWFGLKEPLLRSSDISLFRFFHSFVGSGKFLLCFVQAWPTCVLFRDRSVGALGGCLDSFLGLINIE